ncbi:MAG: VanZ family protein [Treponema sp.]|nr:VanZ family protein [Treponema sp.]
MKAVLKWIPSAIIIICSWYLSSQPSIEHLPKFTNADKLIHFIGFGGLCFWIAFALKNKRKLSITYTSIYGIIDEIHQSFVFGRTCSIFDWIADTLGAIAGFIIFTLINYIITGIINNYRQRDTSPLSR